MSHPSPGGRRAAANGAAATAIRVVELARDERFAEIEELFAPPLQAAVSAETLRIGWVAEIGKNGPVSTVGEPICEPVKAGLVRVSVPVMREHGALTVIMSVDDAGMLQGLRISSASTTAWSPPSY